MKTPRRAFVVEYKTSRRQTQAQRSSIWGNLDLGAFAQQIEADGILPKADKVRDELVVDRTVFQADASVRKDCKAADPVPSSQTEDVSSVALTQISASKEPRRDLGRIASTPNVPVRSSKRKPASIERPLAPRRNTPTVMANGSVELDLEALEEENRRLKRLMIIKLREENEFLALMLAR